MTKWTTQNLSKLQDCKHNREPTCNLPFAVLYENKRHPKKMNPNVIKWFLLPLAFKRSFGESHLRVCKVTRVKTNKLTFDSKQNLQFQKEMKCT